MCTIIVMGWTIFRHQKNCGDVFFATLALCIYAAHAVMSISMLLCSVHYKVAIHNCLKQRKIV